LAVAEEEEAIKLVPRLPLQVDWVGAVLDTKMTTLQGTIPSLHLVQLTQAVEEVVELVEELAQRAAPA
jgi:hypothetical protein